MFWREFKKAEGEKMTIFGSVMMFILVIWTFISFLLMRGFDGMLNFLRSMNFATVCVGYIIILALFYVLKNVFRNLEDE